MEIFIKKLDGKRILLKVDPTDEVSYVKAVIEDKEKIPADQQILIFCVNRLEDKNSLIYYSIARHSTFWLVYKLR